MKNALLKVSGAVVGLVPASVFAAVPAEVTAALADMKTDALVVAAAFLIAIIAILAFKMMRKGA